MSSDDPGIQSLSGHLRTLGGCWIVYGVIRLVLATLLVLYSGTATVMFGALLSRVPDPFTLMGVFHFMYIVMIALSVVCGILGLMAGLALLGGKRVGPHARAYCRILVALQYSAGHNSGNLYARSFASTWCEHNRDDCTFQVADDPIRFWARMLAAVRR